MTRRDPAIALRQMLDAAQRAVAITAGRSRQDLERNDLLDLAAVRLLEILGEAANRVPRTDQARYPAVPWQRSLACGTD